MRAVARLGGDTVKAWTRVAGVLALGLASTGSLAQTLSLEGGGVASLTGIVPQAYAQFVADEGIKLQVILGQTLTRSALKLAAGRIDVAVVPSPAFRAMQVGDAPYSDNALRARELAADLRTLFGFPGGTFHPLTWADSGIDSWADLAGKRVYIGPPAGAASSQIEGIVELASGLKVGEDYEGVRAPWSAAQQAFQDGQFDVYFAALAVGSQSLKELSRLRPLRLLDLNPDLVGTEDWDRVTTRGSLTPTVVPAGTYAGLVDDTADRLLLSTSMMMAVNATMEDETAYRLTTAFWSNLGAMVNANALMRSIDPVSPFGGVNVPIHPGALRYYAEVGIPVPPELLP
ncbi:MAG: TAXI family TRAP transporter solute-binding subunit [Pseudomonadota bacterium]